MRKIFIAILCCCSYSASATGGLLGTPPLDRLTNQADTIIVADLSNGFAATSTPGSITGKLLISRVLKGTETAGTLVQVSWQRAPQATTPPLSSKKKREGILFLKHHAAGLSVLSFTIPSTDLEDISIPAVSPLLPEYSYAAQASVIEKVLSEIANVAESAPENPLLQFVHHGSLEKYSSSAILGLYTKLSQSTSRSTKALGLAGLIRRGDVGALGRLEVEGEELSQSSEGRLLEFGIEAHYRNPDPTGVAILGRLATNPATKASLRGSTAGALASIHTKESLLYLSQLLDSPDPELQSFGVGGLAMFANQGPNPQVAGVPMSAQITGRENAPFRTQETMANFAMGKEAFEVNSQKYLQFWKSWWAQNRQKISQ
jgi:hypothetical protein